MHLFAILRCIVYCLWSVLWAMGWGQKQTEKVEEKKQKCNKPNILSPVFHKLNFTHSYFLPTHEKKKKKETEQSCCTSFNNEIHSKQLTQFFCHWCIQKLHINTYSIENIAPSRPPPPRVPSTFFSQMTKEYNCWRTGKKRLTKEKKELHSVTLEALTISISDKSRRV